MTHAQQLREIADTLDSGTSMFPPQDRLHRIADELEALNARAPMTDEQIDAIARVPFPKTRMCKSYRDFARAVESHHNIPSKDTSP